MLRLGKCLIASILAAVPATALAASGSGTLPGTWHQLRSAPFAVAQETASVWTGKQLIVFGRTPITNPPTDVAEAYDPARDTWTRLAPPPGAHASLGYKAVWSDKEILAFGAFDSAAFNPTSGKWRELRRSIPGGITVWTGREAIGWGGGCCGDAQSNGAAYNPVTDTFRKLSRSPLGASQRPLGAWTGRELILFVSGFDADGKALPARFARAAAYDPAKNSWRRIAPMPEAGPRFAGTAVWDGHDVLVAGTGAKAQSMLAYNPGANRWLRLAPLPAARVGAAAVWTGRQLFLWGGQMPGASTILGNGVAYDVALNRWSSVPAAPLRARSGSTVAWTGHALIVWGGLIGTPLGTRTPPKFPHDGAAFTPAVP
jgi:N-acetylneuraminic acid mutarotase